MAVIEFAPDGTILSASEKFLAAVGYSLAEIEGKHHSTFIDPAEAASAEYTAFWNDLRHGTHRAAQFRRIGKGGREIWIEASYNPVVSDGKVVKIVKIAVDITAQKATDSDRAGKLAAIDKSQATIEFALDGTVMTANQNFLATVGYTLDEIKGRHHSLFVESDYAASQDYRRFWDRLRAGEYCAARFRRIGKGGKEVWIQASYNPIFDPGGNPFKVVKYATDVTGQVALLSDIEENLSEIEGALARSVSQAQVARDAVQSSSGSVQTMAAGAEELASSVREISDTMMKSKTAADAAHSQLLTADAAIKRLTEMSRSMSGIVDLIRGIAGQINLLALNAAIESARAGDAGKGFAVVASEVKNLALQASAATDQIAGEIAGLQTVSGDVVAALDTIGVSVGAVLEYTTGTASAVEEQSAVTREMSTAMQNTAGSVSAINNNMTGITAAMHQVGQVVANTRSAAQVLVR